MESERVRELSRMKPDVVMKNSVKAFDKIRSTALSHIHTAISAIQRGDTAIAVDALEELEDFLLSVSTVPDGKCFIDCRECIRLPFCWSKVFRVRNMKIELVEEAVRVFWIAFKKR